MLASRRAYRDGGCGLEINLIGLSFARRNKKEWWGGRLSVREGDVGLFQRMEGAFDHVVMNPPYHDPKVMARPRMIASASQIRKAMMPICPRGRRGARALREDGMLTLIHRGSGGRDCRADPAIFGAIG
jgi:tRNA1(Val) A37 N6-methylase TrmN6